MTARKVSTKKGRRASRDAGENPAPEERPDKHITSYSKQEGDTWLANERRVREVTDDEVRGLADGLILGICEDSDEVARFLLLVNALAAQDCRCKRNSMAQIVKNAGAPYLLRHDAVVAQSMADVLDDLRARRRDAQ